MHFGEGAVAHFVSVAGAGLADHLADVGLLLDEAWHVLAAQPQQVFGDQHLAIASG